MTDRHDEFIAKVEVFHQALVAATGLKTITFMSRMLLNLAGKHQIEFQRRHPRSLPRPGSKSHRAGLRSYCQGDRTDRGRRCRRCAVAHWRLHLTNANATWTSEGEGSRIVDSLGG
jgi:DNA-binding GntR family transcriptional regulator